jgi:hypothetical protein
MTVPITETAAAELELPLPEEPVTLRNRMRDLAQNAPAEAVSLIAAGEAIADPLWEVWAPCLLSKNADRATLIRILAGYQRELWLWVAGERTWQQCADGIAGRIKRRLG